MAEYEDWFEKQIKRNQAELARQNIYTGQKYGTAVPRQAQLPDLLSLESYEKRALREQFERSGAPSASATAEQGRTAARLRVAGQRSTRQSEMFPEPELPTEDGPRGPGGPSVSSVFAPLFDALNQQRRNAESRYTANAGQIQNIYGQLIGARSADVDDIQEAYSRLQEAAASRGESTLGKMEAREQARQAENQAVLQSMGVGDIGSAASDVASEMSAVAQDVEMMNQSNWAGMLDVMGKTSEELARADATSYGYRQMEDIAKLQAAKEDYLNEVANQEFELKFQEQQAKLAAAQAAAKAQADAEAEAARQQAKAEEQQFEMSLDYLKTADPITRAIGEESLYRGLTEQDQANARAAYNAFMQNADLSRYGMTAQEALAVIRGPEYSGQLSQQAQTILGKAILYTFAQ